MTTFYSISLFCFFLFLHTSTSVVITNHLKIALFELEPFCMKGADGQETGFLVDLTEELLQRVNRSGTQSVTYETRWLALDKNISESGMWDVVRAELLKGNTDLALVPLADTWGWNGVIQLSQPYMLAPILAMGSKQKISSSNTQGDNSILNQIHRGNVNAIYVSGSAAAYSLENDKREAAKKFRQLIAYQGNLTSAQVSTYAEGVAIVQNSASVLVGEHLRLHRIALQSKNCDLMFDPESIIGVGAYTLPIALQVQSQPLLSSINTNLLNMRQDGTIKALKTKYWPVPASKDCRILAGQFDILSLLDSY